MRAVGTIGLALLAQRRCASLRCVEINGEGEAAFDESLAAMRAAPSGQHAPATYHVMAASKCPTEWLEEADLLVVDPPRKGLEPELLQQLTSLGANAGEEGGALRLAYLSCGFQSLAHDASVLLASGNWSLVHAHAFIFFPGTDSLETLAVFQRM